MPKNLNDAYRFAAERLATWFINPRVGSLARASAVVLLVLGIGVIDYLAGLMVSFKIFYLVPVTLAVAWIGWKGGVVIALASALVPLLGDYLVRHPHGLPIWSWWNTAVAVGTYLVVIGILHGLISLHRRLEERVAERTAALRQAAEERQRLEKELLDIAARERNAVGRELHDELGQHLVGTALAAQVLAQTLEARGDQGASDARAIVRWVEEGIGKTRQLARGLLLSAIKPECFPAELANLALTSSRDGISCRFRMHGDPRVADATTAAQLFRIAQEATRNAIRHGRASNIDVVLSCDDGTIRLTIKDNGQGLSEATQRGDGFGLRIMRTRAGLIGGALSLSSTPGEGTCVVCTLHRSPAINASVPASHVR